MHVQRRVTGVVGGETPRGLDVANLALVVVTGLADAAPTLRSAKPCSNFRLFVRVFVRFT